MSARLIDFARACKAAARAVLLYPEGHPAIAATLGRIAHITAPASLSAPLKITVLPDSLLLDDRVPMEGRLTARVLRADRREGVL